MRIRNDQSNVDGGVGPCAARCLHTIIYLQVENKKETGRLLSGGLIACAPTRARARAAGSRTLERTPPRRVRLVAPAVRRTHAPEPPLLRAPPGIAEQRTGRSHGARAQLVGSNGGRQHVRSTTSSIRASGVPWRKSLSPR